MDCIAVTPGKGSRWLLLYPNNTGDPNPLAQTLRIFSRAFSACSFVLNGLDSGVNSRPTYLKSNHCSVVFGHLKLIAPK
jgi:hypothetical protein